MFGSHKLRTFGMASAIAIGVGMAGSAIAADMPKSVHPLDKPTGASEVAERLQELGFKDVGTIEHSGNIYRFDAMWEGEWVKLSVDERDASITRVGAGEAIATGGVMSAEKVRDELQRLGYEKVSGIEQSGDVIHAKASKGGEPYTLKIDARNGEVMRVAGASAIKAEGAITPSQGAMGETYFKSELSKLGYSDVRNVEKKGGVYEMQARMGGQWQDIKVDGSTGAVTKVN
ncbi:PepSY domain-containing protein [Oceanibacterium hippocampi]|uniref:PepSY domain-containing protein n=1 Tax=Oceanibacterium hippocampi TaxID=745714 RepID=A0A1Y5S640_9PROT|nr:PepSY domain-containing protein [Oceanibacterium hippocampi]SLN30599.1 hypothetical protein OCH7691_01073 [Oceanibacterium hippocampi]